MKRLIFVLSLVSVIGMSVAPADASGRRLGRRCLESCCAVKTYCVPQTCCIVTPIPTVCCYPTAPPASPSPLPVLSYKPTSSSCQECDAATNSNISTGQSVVQGSPQLAAGMTQGQGAEMSHGQVLAQINAYLDRVNGNICGLKSQFPEYGAIINSLSRSEKMQAGETTICYPSLEVWNTRPDIRSNLIRVLTENGVM